MPTFDANSRYALVAIKLPDGYKMNAEAPMAYKLNFEGERGPVDRKLAGRHKLPKPVDQFSVPLPGSYRAGLNQALPQLLLLSGWRRGAL